MHYNGSSVYNVGRGYVHTHTHTLSQSKIFLFKAFFALNETEIQFQAGLFVCLLKSDAAAASSIYLLTFHVPLHRRSFSWGIQE